jgi:hypothetical protein
MDQSTLASILSGIQESVAALRQENAQLSAEVRSLSSKVDPTASQNGSGMSCLAVYHVVSSAQLNLVSGSSPVPPLHSHSSSPGSAKASVKPVAGDGAVRPVPALDPHSRRGSTGFTSKIILTSYPGQPGVEPLPMDWGNADPQKRGPVVVSRHKSTIGSRNGMFSLKWSRLIDQSDVEISYWSTWRFLFHLSRSGNRQQEPQSGPQA